MHRVELSFRDFRELLAKPLQIGCVFCIVWGSLDQLLQDLLTFQKCSPCLDWLIELKSK